VSDDHESEELLQAQLEREAVEEKRADASLDEQEALQHERRAEKARYLAEKLEERVEAERELDD
jgi:hypothetical protein